METTAFDLASLIQAGGTVSTVTVLAIWIISERRDNAELWKIVESLVKLRLRQFEDNQEEVLMELE